MRRLVLFFLLIPVGARADLPLDVTRHGIVYRVPGMAKVTVRKDIRLAGAPGFDLCRPAGKPAARLPVVVFINGVGDGFAGKLKPAVHYNLACAYAQAGRRDEALTALETAVANGYTGAREMAEDTDLAPLRGEARFQALLQKLR